MSGFWGADTEALRQVAGAFGGGGEQLDGLALRLGVLIDSLAWSGPDAETFRAEWSGRVRPGLLERVARLQEQGRELEQHAGEQDDASVAGAGSAGAGPPGAGPSEADTPASFSASASVDVPAVDLSTMGVVDLQLMAASTPLFSSAAHAAHAVSAAGLSEAIGESGLAFPESGMELSPPETDSALIVDGNHELAPGADDQPFGLDADGAPLDLAPDTAYDVGDHGTYYTDGEGRITYVEATGGGKEMNPNLREVFPDATYHVNDSTFYRTDELGRTEHMYVPDVIVDREMSRSQSIQSKIAERWDLAGDGTSEPVEFNAGHVLARQLGGIREEINYTRQWDEVNQARSGQDTIYTYESMMADGISDDGSSYSYETLVIWGEEQPEGVGPEQGSEPWEYVPSGYDVSIHENGEQIVDQHLPNYPDGARFPG
ncbi:hypothetical protein GCM10023160_28560 [Brachybacterium paraconglomeratum]|uniref:hypothetical protein n=1 Tax=Brachybacterium paraconglomeratum TaxID=173362 RepID=UPI0031EAA030